MSYTPFSIAATNRARSRGRARAKTNQCTRNDDRVIARAEDRHNAVVDAFLLDTNSARNEKKEAATKIKNKAIVNSGHRSDLTGYADDSHQPNKPMIGTLYFGLECDCLPWDGCMKCVPIVEVRWGMVPVIESQNIGPRQMEIGYI